MQIAGKHPHPKLLQRFSALRGLDDAQLELLARALRIQTAAPGKQLIERGSSSRYTLLLLTGTLELVAEDGRRNRISSEDDAAREPIAKLLPRRFDVYAHTPVAYLEIDGSLLDGLRELSDLGDEGITLSVETGDTPQTAQEDPADLANVLEARIRTDLENDQLVLPTLPEIALRIGRALDDESTDAQRIATIIQTDPVMTAKIIRTANSALYGGLEAADSCAKAVVRLGIRTTHKLVLSFALREVFGKGPRVIRSALKDLWQHSTRVGALSLVLARLTGRFDPEHALLAGLVHDIGEIPVLTYAAEYPALIGSQTALGTLRRRLRGELGAAIMETWRFPEEFTPCPIEAEDWLRDPGPEPDYCDLLITAQLHAFVGTPRMQEVPRLDQVPAFRKLDLGELTPELSIAILEQAREQVAEAERMLAG